MYTIRGGKLNIIISNSSGEPIYEQIVNQMKSMIIQGELKEGDALPSLRMLARDLRISVITTKRAYEELEREGFVVSVAGKGSFVARKNTDLLREQQYKKIEEQITQLTDLAYMCGVSCDELVELIKMMYKGEM